MKPIYTIMFVLLTSGSVYCQSEVLDSLEQALEIAVGPRGQLALLTQLSVVASDLDLEKSLLYAEQGLQIAEQSQLAAEVADFQFQKGDVLQMMGAYDSAQWYFSSAFEFYEQEQEKSKAAWCLRQMGFTYQNQGQYQLAFEHSLNGLEYYEELGDEEGIAKMYLGLADILGYLEQTDEAIDYCLQAIEMLEQQGDLEGLADAYQYAANTYILPGDYESALQMVTEAVTIKKKLDAPEIEMASLVNTQANVLKQLERYDEALVGYFKAIKVARNLNFPRGISATAANIGDVYLRQKKYAQALPFLLEGVALQEEYGYSSNLPENYDHLSETYKALGDFENALLYREKQADLSAEALSLEKDQATSELRTRYETEKKEALISTQEERLNQQRTVQVFVIGIASLLGLILFLLYRSYGQKQSANQLLAKTNEELEQKMEENELLLQEIHHRVKNNLQVISSLLNLQSASINDPNALQAVQESQNRVRSMALIHQKLYQGKNLAAVEMKDYLETMGQTILDTFGSSAANVVIRVPMEPLEIDVDTAVPLGLIVNELAINACKYAFPDDQEGEISLSLKQTPSGHYQLSVADNGIGEQGLATENHKGTGFGTRLIELLTLQLNGKLSRDYSNGTAITITYPS
ncbi:sensor histidine kinase [Lewinella cohaerens]|uniref:sensor histidine kinase n=1 Tax=Lewinella cohaerens TaxID=70995 RepID=UPI000A04BF67|nr:tetratricopeptide repeat protein [Lewinella cohaerens]